MRVQLAQQARELLGQSDLVIITERVDDVALLIGQMITMGLPEVLDRHIPRHWKQRGLSWGWTAVIWRRLLESCTSRVILVTNGVSIFQTNSTCWPYCNGHALPPRWSGA